ncbi:uncharacterized protein LOC128420344 [Podarcis raffonei]|uniref:uncharacterized protein LOC128420344 n=1 Tax=Podarcis raffonei TaxID=65483 RepID=UPI0023293CF5|nr:uncharacterized protein LOC128420344 [Podarcis raffonei]
MIQIERTGEAERKAGYSRSQMADGCADSMQTVDLLEKNLKKIQDHLSLLDMLQMKVTDVCAGCEKTRRDMEAEEERLAELEAQLKIQNDTSDKEEDDDEEEEEDDDDEDDNDDEKENGILETVRTNIAQLRVKIEAMSQEATELAADLTRCAQQKMVLAAGLEEVLKGKQGAHQRRAEPLSCDQKAKRLKEDGGEGDQEVPAPSLLLQEEAAADLRAEDPSVQEEADTGALQTSCSPPTEQHPILATAGLCCRATEEEEWT